MSVAKHSRIKDAMAVDGVCPYCAVGCAQRVYVKEGKIIDIEGDARSPINEGTLCPKGSNTFQLTINPQQAEAASFTGHRTATTGKRCRSTGRWSASRSASRRRATPPSGSATSEGNILNHTTAIAHLGGATLDNEENYLIKKLFSNLGMVAIENQARI